MDGGKIKMRLLVICVLHAVIDTAVQARKSYILVSPSVIRPGRDFIIEGELLENPSNSLTITAELSNGVGPIATSNVTVKGKSKIQLTIPVPTQIKFESGSSKKKELSLKITGTGGLSFSSTKTVPYIEKSSSVFIQTDKAIYKPGQTVNFRVFGLTPDLKVIFDKLKVELYDPESNKINQWDVSGFEMTKLGGVYVQHQIISEQPVLGTWKLKARLLSYGDDPEEKTFEIDEYVLPKFEIELDLPSFGRTHLPEFKGKVKAKYTFGKPVNGIVDLRVRPKNERFEWINGSRQRISKEIDLQMPINGEVEFTLKMAELTNIQKFLSGSTLVFEANVTEDVTKFKRSDDREISFYSQPIKLSFPASLPDTFKPGLTYDAVVIVAQRDDSVPDMINENLTITITQYRKQKVRPMSFDRSRITSMREYLEFKRMTHFMDTETKKVLKPVFHAIPVDGVVVFPIDINRKITRLDIKAAYNGVSVSRTLKKRHSPSNTYLQMRLMTSKPEAGSTVDVDVRSTKVTKELNYQIYSRGSLVESGKLPMSDRRQTWTFNATSAMAPKAKILLFFVRSDGEIIADGLTINVQGVFENKVDVNFNQTSAAPADEVSLDVRADNGSTVYVLGVDKSVLLMATGNDITQSQVEQELQGYDIKPSHTSSVPGCNWWCWRMPIPVGGDDVKDVFNDAGVLVFTDALVYEHREHPIYHRPFWGRPVASWGRRKYLFDSRRMFDMPVMAHGSVNADFQASEFKQQGPLNNANHIPSSEELAPVKRTRKLFPETWLWRTETVQVNGSVSIKETVPDTITSWIATAFAIHPDTGLGVASPSPQLEVTLPFFVSVNLPYSVIRGEKVIVQVNIHNYSPQPLSASVTLKKSAEFDNVRIEGSKTSIVSIDASRRIMVGKDEVVAVYFPIIPRKLGLVDVNIQAKTSVQADAVNKKLLVEAEGTPREYNLPVLADLKSSGTIAKTVNVEYPLRTVKGSERVRATVIGDLMGPSINGLDKLLKLPTGCGEQNMLKFAPNIFIVKYLEATDNLDETILTKAKDFMTTGYQRELTYAHKDGSFSAFGKRDKSGSTWLTAFVLKSFVQAKPYIFVDDTVINKAIDFLLDQQNADGTFREPGRIVHKAMQGGTTSGNVTLTAYVMVSLLEARVVEGVRKKISAAQTKALSYLETEVPKLGDVYDLSIVGYVLQLAQSPTASLAWTKLDAKAKTEAGTKHWEVVDKVKTNAKPWEKRNGIAVDIEATSYALLSLASKNDSTDPSGINVLKWVTEQRNPDGGFSSTQDTVIALQGIAEMAAIVYSSIQDMTIKIEGTGFSDTLQIQNSNAQVLQSRDLPPDVGAVTVTATGTGIALVQIEVSYNIDSDDQNQSFQLNVALPRETANDFDVMACARWLEEGSSSMAVMEIGSPSGFIGDLVSVYSNPDHKRADIDTKKIILYFDEITAGETCTTVTMHRVGLVAGVQPVAVRIYDYYEPTKQVTEFYVPEVIRRSEVCEICGKNCDFCL